MAHYSITEGYSGEGLQTKMILPLTIEYRYNKLGTIDSPKFQMNGCQIPTYELAED